MENLTAVLNYSPKKHKPASDKRHSALLANSPNPSPFPHYTGSLLCTAMHQLINPTQKENGNFKERCVPKRVLVAHELLNVCAPEKY